MNPQYPSPNNKNLHPSFTHSPPTPRLLGVNCRHHIMSSLVIAWHRSLKISTIFLINQNTWLYKSNEIRKHTFASLCENSYLLFY